jgi:hypothetical protein
VTPTTPTYPLSPAVEDLLLRSAPWRALSRLRYDHAIEYGRIPPTPEAIEIERWRIGAQLRARARRDRTTFLAAIVLLLVSAVLFYVGMDIAGFLALAGSVVGGLSYYALATPEPRDNLEALLGALQPLARHRHDHGELARSLLRLADADSSCAAYLNALADRGTPITVLECLDLAADYRLERARREETASVVANGKAIDALGAYEARPLQDRFHGEAAAS